MPADAASADSRRRRTPELSARRIVRFLPSRRSLAAGAAVAALAVGAYAIALETSLFAVNRIEVTGGSAAVQAEVAHALAPFVGRSLVGLDGGAVLQRTEALPTVVSATYDRAFPNTLHVIVVPEHPVAVLRHGRSAWIVSVRGRVMQSIVSTEARALPRIWIAAKNVRVGETLEPRLGGWLTAALGAAGAFRSRVATASFANGALTFHLRSGLALVLGRPSDVALKVAVAVQVMRQLPAGTRTIDVTVPSRPVTSPY